MRHFKLKISNDISWDSHRSGWRYVLELLKPFQSEEGVILDGFLDATFGFMKDSFVSKKTIPYSEPWIGFWHHPVNIPPWMNAQTLAPKNISNSYFFRKSLPHCRGIFTFSEYLASHLRQHLNATVPVESLYHPTDLPPITFDMDAFLKARQILQIGSWCRRLLSFYRFKSNNFKKIHLINDQALGCLADEYNYGSFKKYPIRDVIFTSHLPNEEYDTLLSKSIVFLDLYDSSVNNTVIECMVRNTPMLINKIAPVIEYLGNDYPLYYGDPEEIPEILNNTHAIVAAHRYLKTSPIKHKLHSTFFLESFFSSSISSTLTI